MIEHNGRLSPDEMFPAGDDRFRVQWVDVPSGLRIRVVEAAPEVADHTVDRTVVCVHGWACLAYSYRSVLPLLASAGVRALALDLPGHGLSDKPEGPEHYTLTALGTVVAEVLDVLGLENVTMVGHSMGGPIAAWVAAERPERVRALALLAPVGFGTIFPLRFVVAITPKAVVPILPYAIPRGLVWLCLRASHGHLRRPTLDDAEEYWAPSQFPAHVGAIRTLLHEFDWKAGETSEALRNIHVPTVVVCGSEDHVVLPDEARRYVTLIPDARFVTVEQAGHAVVDEAPARVVQAILSVTR